ncbi:MAG: hypothetical protein DRI46_11820 [Chloroflexi bacterium]|nr:MAG: hypothetical protein DRI46_11820 [Chloroflexota bacterium]
MSEEAKITSSGTDNIGEHLPDAVQSSQNTILITWYNVVGEFQDLTAATITGLIRPAGSGSVFPVDGTITVTDGENGKFSWEYGSGDVGTPGNFEVQFKAVIAGSPILYSSKIPWKIEDTLSANAISSEALVGVTEEEAAWLTTAVEGGDGVEMLDDLSDVSVSGTPTDDEVLAWSSDGAGWINQTAAEAGLFKSTGGTLSDELDFSGTDHTGIAVISLTTAQRDAIGATNTGAIIYNITDTELQVYTGAAWEAIGGGLTPPGSSTDNAVVRWDGTGANTVQNSGVKIDDDGNINYREKVIEATPNFSYSIDFNAANVWALTLEGPFLILTLSTKPATHSASATIHLIQDGTGSRFVAWPTIRWPLGVEPTLSTAANAEDVVTIWTRNGDVYGALVGKEFAEIE